MAKRFLSPVGLPSGTSNPAVGSSGDLFFRSDLAQIFVYDGADWVSAAGVDSDTVVDLLAEFGLIGGDSGDPNTVTYISQVDGGTPSTEDFVAGYSGGQPDTVI
jgi:hypothetical protein